MPAKPPLPATIEVGPFTYTVTTSRAAIKKAEKKRGAKLEGAHTGAALQICVHPDVTEGRQPEVLLHELLHAVVDATGADLALGPRREEATARALSPLLLDTLRRNPALVAYLTASR